jgi:hypothetical protein
VAGQEYSRRKSEVQRCLGARLVVEGELVEVGRRAVGVEV